MRGLASLVTVLVSVGIAVPTAAAQSRARLEETPRSSFLAPGFVELAGDFGFAFGEQEFLPTGSPGESRNPLTNGFGFNATGGVELIPGLDLILDYSYNTAVSLKGKVTGVLDDVHGTLTYHTITGGLRTSRALGPGRLYGDGGIGVVLPFSTKLEYTYAEPMSQLGISGIGSRVDHYNLGVGVFGEGGYQIPIVEGAYVAAAVRVQSFQSTNDGRSTRYDNFVADFTAPTPLNMEINHGTQSAATPSTYSVQDVRLHLNVGYRF